MSVIEVKMFHTPMVFQDEVQVLFPFRKAEALFYYLVVKGQATRDELVNLFWGEIDEETARKNLRNTMYKIRKSFQNEIIISPQKSIVMLNPAFKISTDLSIFESKTDNQHIHYEGEFLQGFKVKDSEAFENWVTSMREYYRSEAVSLLLQSTERAVAEENYTLAEGYAKKLIQLEPYDERAYQSLLKIYSLEKSYPKGIEVYRRLTLLLEQELGITPEDETKRLYEEIVRLKEVSEEKKGSLLQQDFFYGREAEINRLLKSYRDFLSSQATRSILIIGEAGIGKTKLKERFIERISPDEVYLFHAYCYQAEEDYFLKPWNPIFSKLADILWKEEIQIPILWRNLIAQVFPIFAEIELTLPFKSSREKGLSKLQTAEEAVINLFKHISKNKKVFLVFDDLQWMDRGSLKLLQRILLELENQVMLLATCRNEQYEKIDEFIGILSKEQLLEKLTLSRFSRREVAELIKGALPGRGVSVELMNQIYDETEGNTFFLMEYINTIKDGQTQREMSTHMKDILKGRLIGISEEGRKILNFVSLFFDKVSLEVIQEIISWDELELLERLDELQNKYILREIVEEDKIYFQFTHQKLREYVYSQLSNAKKKLLHNRVGALLEQQLREDKSDLMLYSKLIYHFSHGGNPVATVKYKIKNIDAYFDFTHELYPVLVEIGDTTEKNLYLNRVDARNYLDEIELLLEDLKKYKGIKKEVLELRIIFLHMKGRFFIREGEYDVGLDCINKMVALAEEAKDYDASLRGYRQLIYYGIQIHNLPLMKEYIEKGLALSHEHNSLEERGIFLRLKGLSKILSTQYGEAEEILREALNVFNRVSEYEDKYALNIAAVYNYLGEIQRHNLQFSNALYFYDQAMVICEEKQITRGLTIFNTNAGKTAFDMGNPSRAKEYFQKALEIYSQYDLLWGRAIAEGYMALLHIKENNFQQGLNSLKRAEECSSKLQNPYERGLVNRIKAEIKYYMLQDKGLNEYFKQILPLPLADYYNDSIRDLERVKESYDIDKLKLLKSIIEK